MHHVLQLRAPAFPLCHLDRQCHDLRSNFVSVFVSLRAQTGQGPMLSNYFTVGNLGRSVGGVEQWRGSTWTSLATTVLLLEAVP